MGMALNKTATVHWNVESYNNSLVQHFNQLASKVALMKGIPEALIKRDVIVIPVENFYTNSVIEFEDLNSTSEAVKAFNAVRFALPTKVIRSYRFLMSGEYMHMIKPEDYGAYSLHVIANLLYQGSYFEWLPDEIAAIQDEIIATGTYNSYKRTIITYESIPMRADFKQHLIAAAYIAKVKGYNILDSDNMGFIPVDRLNEIAAIISHLPFFTNLHINTPNVNFDPQNKNWLGFINGSSELLALVNNLYVSSGFDYWKTYYFILNNDLWTIAAVSGFTDIDTDDMNSWVNLPKSFLNVNDLTSITEDNLNYSIWS